MFDLVYGAPVIEWVAGHVRGYEPPPDCQAIGFSRGGAIQAGVAYERFNGSDIHLTIASVNPGAFLRGNIRAVFDYPFNQLGCRRVTAMVAKSNKRSRKMVEGLGFKAEGVHPHAMPDGATAISYGMVRKNCKWLEN